MYTQQEASAIRQRFWISFGRYVSPIPSSLGEKVNWINYRTGIKGINFKMDANGDSATIGIEVSHKDSTTRALYFNHFRTFKKALEDELLEKWEWELNATNASGNAVARICTSIEKVNVYRENDWPAIISFLKTRIVALDKFWNEYKEIFEMLT